MRENRLRYENGRYEIDFEDLECALSDSKTSLLLLCNPHNPSGKVYTKDELSKIAALCKKHNVLVLSDEIHCDITQMRYTPFVSVQSQSITAISPSKAFNLAGLHAATLIIPDTHLRSKIVYGLNNVRLSSQMLSP